MLRVFDGNDIALDFHEGGQRLAITFTSFERDGGAKVGGWSGTVDRLGLSGLFFISKKNHWFNSVELPEALEAANAISRRYDQVTALGGSMGAHAAIRLAERLAVDAVVAVSPQYCIRQSLVPFERRWQDCAQNISHYDTQISEVVPRCPVYIIFDDAFTDDLKHAQLIQRWTEAMLVPLAHSGHSSATALADLRLLDRMFELTGNPTRDATIVHEIERSFAENSDRSATVICNRLEALTASERPSAVAAIPNDVVGIAKSKARLHRLIEQVRAHTPNQDENEAHRAAAEHQQTFKSMRLFRWMLGQ